MAGVERDRIERLARRLRLLVWAAIVAAAVLYGAARLELAVGNFHIVAGGVVDAPGIALARDVSALVILVALWQLTVMLGLIERGDRFSPAVTRHFRRFALLLFVAAAIALVAPPLLTLLAPSPAPHHALQLPLNFRDVWTMLVTGVIFLVARLLDEAQRIEADLREIV